MSSSGESRGGGGTSSYRACKQVGRLPLQLSPLAGLSPCNLCGVAGPGAAAPPWLCPPQLPRLGPGPCRGIPGGEESPDSHWSSTSQHRAWLPSACNHSQTPPRTARLVGGGGKPCSAWFLAGAGFFWEAPKQSLKAMLVAPPPGFLALTTCLGGWPQRRPSRLLPPLTLSAEEAG